MAPAALSTSSSGASSPPTSPGLSTPSMIHADESAEFSFGIGGPGSGQDQSHYGAATPISSQRHQAPIAIVGMSCRLPGGASSPAEFWELCSRARSGFSAGAPKERFNHDAFYDANPGKTGTYHSQGGYFLGEDVAAFDAPFFSLTEKEAIAMDPQQRMLLECTFEALESAGIPKHAVVGGQVGVFIGGSLSEYETHLSRDSESMPMYQSTGCAQAMQSNRLSHYFDFRGPSFTLDTACSSSLVALHVACQSLRNGEASLAVTGGCHLNMLPDSFISFSTGRLLSDSGRSIAFDERGTGFGRGEGCGILVLKPLDQALEDKDAIRAVIVGTGINQDGKTAGITMPNGDAQETLIKHVYKSAGLDPKDCGFVEAHGTGTKIGDPTEAGAIYRSLGQDRSSRDPLFIGSVKSNIGHLEAASGVAAVIKAALMLERGFILPNHDFKTPNKKIPWKEWNMTVAKAQRPWPKGKKYISVNNFGFGGTNAHIVLERAPFPVKKQSMSRRATSASVSDDKEQAGIRRLFVLSGNDKKSLEAVMANLVVYLEQRPEIFQSDLLDHLSYTLRRRSLLKWRVAIPAVTSFELIEALNSNSTVPTKAAITGQSHVSDLKIGFVFTGQGAQWHAMGRELYGQHGYAVYTAALDRADRYLQKFGAEWSLVDELTLRDAATSKVSEAHISQPACTVVQLCLVDLLRSWGIRPAAVTGHSSGEIAAAYAAGFISFENAVAVAYHRGRMIPLLKQTFTRIEGSMMAVGGSKEEVQPLIDLANSTLKQTGEQVRIACYNSPSSFTISGDAAGITRLEEIIREKQPDTFNRRLQVDVAYHSHHMDLVAKQYMEALKCLSEPRSGSNVAFYSSLHGQKIEGHECNAKYWVDNLTRPVRFSEALDCMVKDPSEETPVNMLIELGPHSALQGPIKQILQAAGVAKSVAYTSALVRKRGAVQSALDLAAAVIAKGGLVRVDAVNAPSGSSAGDKLSLLTDLPRYAWNHQSRYWHDSRMSKMHTHRGSNGVRSELIGVEAIYSTNIEPTWRNVFGLDDLPWLRHHQIQGLTVFPLAGFVAMAIEAASQKARKNASKNAVSEINVVDLKDIEVTKPLAFPANVVEGNGNIELSISLRRRHDPLLDEEWDEFRISSWSTSSEWTEHCAGLVMTRSVDTLKTASRQSFIEEATVATQTQDAVEITSEKMTTMYETLSENMGVGYGPSFQGIRDCKVASHFAVGTISSTLGNDDNAASVPFLHATALESIIETYWPILRSDTVKASQDTVYLPSSIRHMSIMASSSAKMAASGLRAHCTADFSGTEDRPTTVDIIATGAAEASDAVDIVVSIEGLTVSPILEGSASESDEDHGAPRQLCYKYEWEEVEQEDVSDGQAPLQDADVVIMHSDDSYLMATQLAITLESVTSRLPSLEVGIFEDADANTAEQVKSMASGKTCIVLTELDEPFLADATEHQFEALKALAGAAHRILWLSRDAYLNAAAPGANMISGLSRTIRSETTMPFAHLDLEESSGPSGDAEAVSGVIVDVLRRAFDGSGVRDMEFVYREGKLLVPRVVSDDHMNQLVKRDTDPNALDLQPFGLATAGGRALRMQFQTVRNASSKTDCGDVVQGVHFSEDLETTSAPLGDDEVEFEVRAVGVSRYDAQVACSPDSSATAGLEASGVVTRLGAGVAHPSIRVGSRIACLTTAMTKKSSGALASAARTTCAAALRLPDSATEAMSFEQGAALPLAYCTAYYSLMDQARLESGQRVLVTNPSEPVGQAAICLASITGAEVFAVVDSPEEEAAVLSRHQTVLSKSHIVLSSGSGGRDTYDAVMRVTNGVGADVVISAASVSAKDAHLQQLWTACLAPFGCLVQVQEPKPRAEQHNSRAGGRPNLHQVRPSSLFDNVSAAGNTSCTTVDMLALASARPQVLTRVFAKVAGLFETGKIHPIGGLDVLPFSRAHEALRKLQDQDSGVSTKCILLAEADDQILAPPAAISKNILKSDATYLIVGGTGGLGRSMARWMVQHGAAHIVLLSRRGTVTPAVQALADEAQASGAHIHVRPCDVADESSVSALLAWISSTARLPPVRGVIHSAMVLHDVLFEKMAYAEYKAVIESKVQGAWNLHRATDGQGDDDSTSSSSSTTATALDFFVAISSVSAVVGNRGQAAYAAANTYLDALVQHRLARGLPAVSLALAAVSDAGYLADAEGGGADRAADVLRNLGGDTGNTICEAEVLALLHAAVAGETAASARHHVITGVGMGDDRKKSLPFWADDAKFAQLADAARAEAAAEGGEDGKGAALSTLNPSLTQAEAEEVVCNGLVAKIAEVLMMEPDELDVTRSLSHYPLDSLVAIEIRNFIARQYEASMQVLELLSSGSIQTLSSTVCRKSKLCQF